MSALGSQPTMSRIPSTATSISTMPVQPYNKEASERRRARAMSNTSKPLDGFIESAARHTWIIPGAITAIIFVSWLVSNPFNTENPYRAFVLLSYPSVRNGELVYGKGRKDFMFVAFYAAFFTFLRELAMEMIVEPIARRAGLKKSKKDRFMEQCYACVHYTVLGVFGLVKRLLSKTDREYVMSTTSMWFLKTDQMYVAYPHKTHSAVFKSFYLLQAANWTHLLVVLSLQLEKPRKDFFELTIHHITTLLLIFLSYRFHFTWIGVPVFWTHDISDIILTICKILNYLGATDPVSHISFGIFTAVWVYTRHYLGLKILYSILTEFRTVGLWELNWEEQLYKCWISQYITFALLSIIQLLDSYWLCLILRIGWRIYRGGEVKDDREDDDDNGEGEKEKYVPI